MKDSGSFDDALSPESNRRACCSGRSSTCCRIFYTFCGVMPKSGPFAPAQLGGGLIGVLDETVGTMFLFDNSPDVAISSWTKRQKTMFVERFLV